MVLLQVNIKGLGSSIRKSRLTYTRILSVFETLNKVLQRHALGMERIF